MGRDYSKAALIRKYGIRIRGDRNLLKDKKPEKLKKNKKLSLGQLKKSIKKIEVFLVFDLFLS